MAKPLLSIEDYEGLPEEDEYLLELVRGRLIREPRPNAVHGLVALKLIRALDKYVEEHGLGLIAVETGFLLADDPPTVRGPDVAFIARENLPPEGIPDGFWRRGPDLAVEVVSPANAASEMQEKALEYLAGGSRLVWVVHPLGRSVTVYRSRDQIRVLLEGESLDGGDALPGFRLAVADLFEPNI